MRKGLVVTLGVVALVLAVSPGFAEAPLISCIPDIVVSDVEQNSQTADINFFIFSDAINLDDYVQDADTSESVLRWSFIETTGNTLEINGIGSNTSGDLVEPGLFDIRAVSQMATFHNVGAGPAEGSTEEATIEMVVSDGTSTASQTVKVTTVNVAGDTGQGDALVPAVLGSWDFGTGDDGWTWYDAAPALISPAHTASAGSLQITESVPHSNIVFGGWESPKDPAVAVQPKLGCVMRARYTLRATGAPSPAATPGFRLRGVTKHVAPYLGSWEPDFTNQDYTSDYQAFWGTLDFIHVVGREPGATAKTYTSLVYPQQVAETLLSTDTVTYFTCDLMDLEGNTAITGNADQGTILIDEVTVDGFTRPALGSANMTQVAELTTTDFTSWSDGVTDLNGGTPGNIAGVVVTPSASGVSIAVAPGSSWYEAYAENAGAALTPGRYYRTVWTLTSTATPGGDFGPTVRCSLVSSKFVFSADKQLAGGGLYTVLGPAAQEFEVWAEAPSEDPATPGATEAMKIRFTSWGTESNTNWPFFADVSGTVAASGVVTEVMDAP